MYDGAGLLERVDLAGSDVEIDYCTYDGVENSLFKFKID